MSVAEVLSDDTDNAGWIQMNLSLDERFAGVVDGFTEAIHLNMRARSDSIALTRAAVGVLLANLLRAAQLDRERYVIITLDANHFSAGPTNPFGVSYRAFSRVVKFFSEGSTPFIELRRGGQFRSSQGLVYKAYSSKVRGTAPLWNMLFDRAGVSQDIDPFGATSASLYHLIATPIIRLRDEHGSNIQYDDNFDIAEMRERLTDYNNFLALQWVDLLLPDMEFSRLAYYRKSDDRKDAFGESRDEDQIDLLFQRSLYRVFNNSCFDQGGRFYGGWWQRIPSKLRRYVTINWTPTVELDFSNMQAAMLYAREGADIEGDAYTIDGISAEYRPLIKRTFFKLINATDGRIKAPRKDQLPQGWTWRSLQDAIRAKHSRVATYFNSGIGIFLQRQDADIAEEVMLQFMVRDILILPIHDSFLVYPGQVAALKTVMHQAYREKMGREIAVDIDELFLTRDNPEAIELDELDVRSIDDTIYALEHKPEYSGYLRRKTEFLKDKSDEWRFRFYT